MERETEEWANRLVDLLNREFERQLHVPGAVQLQSQVGPIPAEFRSYPNYGHPVEWAIYGVTGTVAFAIGRMKAGDPEDDDSEKHLMPPILTITLNSLPEEYAYSQVAIVVVPMEMELSDKQKKWLTQWLDVPNDIRHICLQQRDEVKEIVYTEQGFVKQLMRSVLSPWQMAKVSEREMEDFYKDTTYVKDDRD